MITWSDFISIPDGTQIFNYGSDECVALVNHYHENVLGLPLPAGFTTAKEWWTQRSTQPNIYGNFTFSSVPMAGAIVVSLGGIYDATAGHIGVVTAVNPDGTFDTMEQNTGPTAPQRYVYRYRRGLANILGFLIPNNNPAVVPPYPAQRKVKNMIGLMINDGLGTYGPPTTWYYATYDGYAFVNIGSDDANEICTHLGASHFANVTYAGWEAYKGAAQIIV